MVISTNTEKSCFYSKVLIENVKIVYNLTKIHYFALKKFNITLSIFEYSFLLLIIGKLLNKSRIIAN